MKALALAALALALAGCVNFGDKADSAAVTYYVLVDATPAPPGPAAGPSAPTLLVLDTAASGFYDGEPLVFSRTPGTRGQYQFARWTERPGKRFADLLRARLDTLGTWRIAAAGGYVRGDRLLDTELVEFYHDASSAPGTLRLVLRAELVDLGSRDLVSRRTFAQNVALTSFDAAGAARAANLAVAQVLDDVSAWLATAQ
ncbi:MAG: ABC-type transport auxiliary lipoprotein family protein [Pseudomonadota bacterium]